MSRLEVYAIALGVLALAIVGAYFKGRQDESRETVQEQLAANAKALEEAATAASARAVADDDARRRAQTFIDQVDKGLANVQTRFAKIPTVVVDDRGCPRLNATARLHWNAVSLLPAGSTLDGAGSSPAALPTGTVPAP